MVMVMVCIPCYMVVQLENSGVIAGLIILLTLLEYIHFGVVCVGMHSFHGSSCR